MIGKTGGGAALCIDFRKAYDTLDRHFLQMVLRACGFSEQIIRVIQLLHDGTTAQFLVNGMLSQQWPINSGICQGCPLAPLLFNLAIDTLSQAINRTPQLWGILIAGPHNFRHKITGFFDDSTIFLINIKEIDIVTKISTSFGELSGLCVQRQKSILIDFNKANTPIKWNGYPVLQPHETTRQLGYWVGNRDTTTENWQIRLKKYNVGFE